MNFNIKHRDNAYHSPAVHGYFVCPPFADIVVAIGPSENNTPTKNKINWVSATIRQTDGEKKPAQARTTRRRTIKATTTTTVIWQTYSSLQQKKKLKKKKKNCFVFFSMYLLCVCYSDCLLICWFFVFPFYDLFLHSYVKIFMPSFVIIALY